MNKLTDDQIFALAAKSHGCGLSADDLKSCEGEGSAAEFFASELLTFARSIESAHTAPAGDPVATLHVSDFRGYENYEFQHLVDLPPGNYELFTACTTQHPQPAEKPMSLKDVRSLIADDSFAISFQSLGQYRTHLLKFIDEMIAKHQEMNNCDSTESSLSD